MACLLTVLLSFALTASRACDCGWLSMRQQYRQADLVVQVHIASLRDSVQYDLYSQPVQPPFTYGSEATARVQRVFKGTPPAGKLLLTGQGSSMCNFRFRRGGSYVVFLYKRDINPHGHYVTSSCQRHFSLHEAAARQEFQQARRAEK